MNALARLDSIVQAVLRFLAKLRPPRRIMPTRAGLFVLAAPIVLGTAAINSSNNLLFMLLGGTLGAIVISGVLSERAIWGVTAEIAQLGDVHAGEPARLLVRIDRGHDARLDVPAFGLRVRERMPRRRRNQTPPLDATIPMIEGRTGRAVASRLFTRRGRAALEPCELITTYPFGLLGKRKDVDVECTLIVRPRRVEVPVELASPRGAAAGGRQAAARGLGEDVYGLRERDDRDPAHRIHAMRSLSLGREVVVETEAMKKPTAWLGVANVDGANDEAFERAVEIAAATLVEWDRGGYAVGLRTASRSFAPGSSSISDLLDALSLLALESGTAVADDGDPVWIVPAGARVALAPDSSTVMVAADGRLS
jgi:uncharacterized protein (DUF58 family)